MALEATHIRYALDIQDKLGVVNLEHYISGTLYPDSRYISAVSRDLTHPEELLDKDLAELTDFQKGWLAHLLCDNAMRQVTKNELPEVFTEPDNKDTWVRLTALKILQDIDDAQQFPLKNYLPYFDYAENPNGENLSEVLQFNKIFQILYVEPKKLEILSYNIMLEESHIEQKLATEVIKQTQSYQTNKRVMSFIQTCYQKMLSI